MNRESILFFDLEINPKTKNIIDIGSIYLDKEFHSSNLYKFKEFSYESETICGHNIIFHDLEYLKINNFYKEFFEKNIIDTLFLSALLFPEKPYHHLVKDYRLNKDELNNPLSDSKISKRLFHDLISKYDTIKKKLKIIYFNLLKAKQGFSGFFELYREEILSNYQLEKLINNTFKHRLCTEKTKIYFIENNPIEFAYALAIISTNDIESITPPWVIHTFPEVVKILNTLRFLKCENDSCSYCSEKLNVKKSLYNYFAYKDFRKFEGDTDLSLQEIVVNSALKNESLLAIFPTGGGKSLTFQLPALIQGEAERALTVVISPLQSLMKDQIDVLKKRFGITRAVTINGLLSPLERSEAISKIQEGGASILYISPESLRLPTILKLLKKRNIARFVIDEAHSFSTWGQDFRVDYLYISEFITLLMNEKKLVKSIPVSCFTATAKPAVIEDIVNYFKNKLDLDLKIFKTSSKRHNLNYSVFDTSDEIIKYKRLKNLLNEKIGTKIIYVSKTKKTEKIAEKLKQDGFSALAFHGKMESDRKIQVQNSFMEGETDIIVATSAFGMGVDKDNVEMVIHYDISDSLENYVQEAGRAGRNENLSANCYILFDNKDLDEHFNLLNQTKLNHKEISQIWRGIKSFKREKFTRSALEIAKAAGWNSEVQDIETRVKSALAALEDSGYLKRGLNSPRVFADSFLIKNVSHANSIIDNINLSESDKISAKRIFQHLITYNETRVDYISDILGLSQDSVVRILNVFKENNIIGDNKDLTAFVNISQGKRNSRKTLLFYHELEKAFYNTFNYKYSNDSRRIYIKEVNEILIEKGYEKSNIESLKTILRYWSYKNYIILKRLENNLLGYEIIFKNDKTEFDKIIEKRLTISSDTLEFLHKNLKITEEKNENLLSEFSLIALRDYIESLSLFSEKNELKYYEDILLYLHEIESIKLESGIFVLYNPFNIERIEKNNQKQYTKENYKKLENFYEQKIEQIHIVGEYAKKMYSNYEEAMNFVDDYFTMDYKKFINKYFPNKKTDLKRPLTEERFKEIFGSLSTEQLGVIKDNTRNILVSAGPGSGKTRILVHKVASLLVMEDIKPEQFLMLTFSRPAALEFKKRLSEIVGRTAYYTDIFTYHSLAFSILGRLGNLEKSGQVIKEATLALEKNEYSGKRIDYKSVLVIDEYQDISEDEFNFINSIISQAEDIRVIAVGDDDQNIYEFRGSSVKYMKDFKEKYNSELHYLTINYRSRDNLVNFSNQFIKLLQNRMKEQIELRSFTNENGLIRVKKYNTKYFITPFINEIQNLNLNGTTAILTSTNEESMLINNQLNENSIKSKILMSHEGFKLKDIIEVRTFSYYIFKDQNNDIGLITDDIWNNAKNNLYKDFSDSKNLDLALLLIENFEKSSNKKFKSDFKNYLDEIRIEDLYSPEKESILVSTMHKAKGKEFDNVFLIISDFKINTNEKIRTLYVALTRAKENLYIYTNQNHFDNIKVHNLIYDDFDKNEYNAPNRFSKQMNLKDIHLGLFKDFYSLDRVRNMKSGDNLYIENEYIFDKSNKPLIKFSKGFSEMINKIKINHYYIKSITINYIVIWYDKETDKEFRIPLPLIVFEK